MKITRLKRGFHINLSDGEFEALNQLVAHGMACFEGEDPYEWDHMTRGAKHHIFKGTFSHLTAMLIGEDRR